MILAAGLSYLQEDIDLVLCIEVVFCGRGVIASDRIETAQ